MCARQVARLAVAHDQRIEDILVHLDPCGLHHLQDFPCTFDIPNLGTPAYKFDVNNFGMQVSYHNFGIPGSALISGTGRSLCLASRLLYSYLPVPEVLQVTSKFYRHLLNSTSSGANWWPFSKWTLSKAL